MSCHVMSTGSLSLSLRQTSSKYLFPRHLKHCTAHNSAPLDTLLEELKSGQKCLLHCLPACLPGWLHVMESLNLSPFEALCLPSPLVSYGYSSDSSDSSDRRRRFGPTIAHLPCCMCCLSRAISMGWSVTRILVLLDHLRLPCWRHTSTPHHRARREAPTMGLLYN